MRPVDYRLLTQRERAALRLAYVAEQKGLCAYCAKPLTGPPAEPLPQVPLNLALFPPGFLNHPVHLHHDHDTGMTKGAIHARCNGILWQYHGE